MSNDELKELFKEQLQIIEAAPVSDDVKKLLTDRSEGVIEELAALKDKTDRRDVENFRVKHFGKSGDITELTRLIGKAPVESKKATGAVVNGIRNFFEKMFAEAEKEFSEREYAARIRDEALDVTLSRSNLNEETGALNPISIVKNDIVSIFAGMGFSVVDGPEIEFTKYNFELLNIPEDHPARDPGDSFYINPEILLRTQTSCVQARTMLESKPPIRVVCPGKVYRPDEDATHSPMFHQIEGLVVDENVTLKDLKAVLEQFARRFFSENTKVRFRPSFFPFTEPSVEVDLSCAMCGGKGCRLCKGTGWLELLGAGVVNPAVFDMCGIDSKKYSGFAFGMGLERAAMVKYGIPDMRLLFDNDKRILSQFK